MRLLLSLLAGALLLATSQRLQAQPRQAVVTHRAKLVVGTGHTAEVMEADLMPDGKFLVTDSVIDNTVRVWEVATGREIRVFRDMFNACPARDSKTFVCGSDDGTVHLWDLTTGKELRTFQGEGKKLQTTFLTDDNKFLLTGSRGRHFSHVAG